MDAETAARWSYAKRAELVSVDAPCGWSTPGKPRRTEELLRHFGYSLYATPTRDVAVSNPTFAWMLNGERLFEALRKHFPLLASVEDKPPFCFETYPFVASCAYAGKTLKKADKNRDRRQILRSGGIDETILRNQDFVDAGICALVANSVAIDYCEIWGEPSEGCIVTPPWPPGLAIDPETTSVLSEDGDDPFR